MLLPKNVFIARLRSPWPPRLAGGSGAPQAQRRLHGSDSQRPTGILPEASYSPRSLEPLVIVGAGGFGREVLGVAQAVNARSQRFQVLGFLDDGDVNAEVLEALDARLLGSTAALQDLEARYVIAVGSPTFRRQIDEWASLIPRHPATVVHPQSTVGPCSTIGAGCVIMPGARLTTNIVLGRHVHVDQNATIGHDAVLDDYSRVNPGAAVSGNVHLRAEATVGAGAVVLQGLTVGHGAVVGAGAVVVRDVPPGWVVTGIPATRLLK